MVLVSVTPATKLPLHKPQRFTYQTSAGSVAVGTVVDVPLGRRAVAGLITGQAERPRGISLKTARPRTTVIATPYLALVERLSQIYRVSQGLIVKLLLSGAVATKKNVTTPAAPTDSTPIQLPKLTDDQTRASATIKRSLGSYADFLLDGITGSGKTEVYADVAERVLRQGQQVVLLVPEIAIATHLVERLQRYFGPRAAIWHSGLRGPERSRIWSAAVTGQPMLLIGPRSALFVPLAKLGTIILDEEHDGAYKQWDQEPRFHARVVARELARLANCPLILGSATPSIETLQQVTLGKTERLVLPQRFGGSDLPEVQLVDLSATPAGQVLAPATEQALRETLVQGLQAIILLNRRGAAPAVVCQACGHQWRCARCERLLVWHVAPTPHLACHFCALTQAVPSACPECKTAVLRLQGVGTQRVEAELKALYPAARVARLDADISRSAGRLADITNKLSEGAIDLLVGTQLVAKGWDLEKLHLVVVLNADQGLQTPDFRAHERTVQLLWQVAGRAGRRKKRGQVLIETHYPEHPAIRAIVQHNYATFAEQELAERKRYGYPPFRHIVTLYHEANPNDPSVVQRATTLTKTLLKKLSSEATNGAHSLSEILPPTIHTLPRGKKIVALSVLTQRPAHVLAVVPPEWSVDLDPEQLLS
ncbi:MAG: primosomal protein N' [Candidatus Andersenbacteria bacterium]